MLKTWWMSRNSNIRVFGVLFSSINLFSTHQLPLGSRLETSGSPFQGQEGDRAAVVGDSLTFVMILSHSGQVQGQGNPAQLPTDTKSMALEATETRDRQS